MWTITQILTYATICFLVTTGVLTIVFRLCITLPMQQSDREHQNL